MSQQLSLLPEPPKARRRDPATSHAAADRAKALQVAHECLILGALRQGPAGKDGIAVRTQLTGVAVARRLSELERVGAAKPTGRLVKSTSGRDEREWAITAKAIQP